MNAISNMFNPGKPDMMGQGFGQPQNGGIVPPMGRPPQVQDQGYGGAMGYGGQGQGGFGQGQFMQNHPNFAQRFGQGFGQGQGGFGFGQGFGGFGGGFQPGQGFGGGGSVAQNMGQMGAQDWPGMGGVR